MKLTIHYLILAVLAAVKAGKLTTPFDNQVELMADGTVAASYIYLAKRVFDIMRAMGFEGDILTDIANGIRNAHSAGLITEYTYNVGSGQVHFYRLS